MPPGQLDTPAPARRSSHAALLIAIAGTLALVALVVAVEPLRAGVSDAVRGDTAELRSGIDDLGAAGPAIILALAVIHTVVWYPTEIVNAAAGFVYGFWPALAMVMAGWTVNGLIAYWAGRRFARAPLRRFAGAERFDRAEAMIASGGVALLLAVRLIPIVPFSLAGYVAGVAHVPLLRYAWTTAVGYLPLTAMFVYLGARLDEISATDPVLLAGAAVLVALIVAAKWLVPSAARRDRARQPG